MTSSTSPFLKDLKPSDFPTDQGSVGAQDLSQKNTDDKTQKSPQRPRSEQIPVTIFTGYLGSGKTTVITNLMNSMPADYKIAWLKNEIGSTAVDTELATSEHTSLVKEMLQGCICHVMLGALGDALEELLSSNPDRIIIETSGSATPAPVVWEIRDHPRLFVDGVVTVIDAINFHGYLDKSFTLKMQAKHTDLILINKHEGLDESTLETNLDDLYEINLDTPKIKTDKGSVSHELIFGLDSTLFSERDTAGDDTDAHHQEMEVDLIEAKPTTVFSPDDLSKKLDAFPGKLFYRIKAVLHGTDGPFVLNYAFGDHTISPLNRQEVDPRIVFMGEDMMDHKEKILSTFSLAEEEITYTVRHHH